MTEQPWLRAFLCLAFLGPFSFLRFAWAKVCVPFLAGSILLYSYLLDVASRAACGSDEEWELPWQSPFVSLAFLAQFFFLASDGPRPAVSFSLGRSSTAAAAGKWGCQNRATLPSRVPLLALPGHSLLSALRHLELRPLQVFGHGVAMTEQPWQRAFRRLAFLGHFSFLRFGWAEACVPFLAGSILLFSYLLDVASRSVYGSGEEGAVPWQSPFVSLAFLAHSSSWLRLGQCLRSPSRLDAPRLPQSLGNGVAMIERPDQGVFLDSPFLGAFFFLRCGVSPFGSDGHAAMELP